MKRVASNHQAYLAMVFLAVLLVTMSCTQAAQPTPATTAQRTTSVPAATKEPEQPKPSQATPSAAKPAGLTLVRAGHMGISSDVYTYIAIEKGYFKEEGIDVELTFFDTAAKMIAPMAAGQLDVGRGSPSAGLFNAIARGVPIKIVADVSRVTPNNNYFALVARKDLIDSGVLKNYSDMKGKNVAYNAKGTGNEIDIEKALKKGNLTPSDVNLIEMPFGDMNVGMANKAVDIALLTEPNITLGEQKGISKLWKSGYDFTPAHQLSVLMFSPSFIKDKPEVAKRYMVAYVKGIRDYYEAFFKGKNKAEIISYLVKYTGTKDPASFEKMVPHGVDPNGYVNAKSIMDDQDWFIAKGYSKDKIDEKSLIDNQFVDYAIQRLGKYQ